MSTMNLEIERNNVTLNTRAFKFIRGDNKDKEFPSIEVAPSEQAILNVAKWLGLDTAASALTRLIKAAAQNSYLESINAETGEADLNKFRVLLQEFTSVSLKKSELEDREFELTTRLLTISDNIEKAIDADDMGAVKELRVESADIKAQLRVTRDAISAKSRQKKAESSAEPAVVA